MEWPGGLAVVRLTAHVRLASVTTTAKPLTELVDDGWAKALAPVSDQIAQMGQFLRAEINAGQRYLPAGPNVLRAFTFPFEEVRVLIVGQDPYPTPGHAVGLSFSVAPDVRPLPRSLSNIFSEYTADLGHPQPSTGDLTPWAQRGVMLLNRVLTVRPGTPASHRGKGWEAVTECAIRALIARDQPMVAILWGRDAATLKPMLNRAGGQERRDPGIDAPRCVAIESAHPSPLSASRGFFGSRPFSRANELLTGMGAEPIDWRLP
jgi:uracil-DNA glycosylase